MVSMWQVFPYDLKRKRSDDAVQAMEIGFMYALRVAALLVGSLTF